MALQSSGPISLVDIATELGVSTSNISLRSVSAAAGFATPDAFSEFYGYSNAYTSDYCIEFTRGDALQKQATTSPFQISNSQDLSFSFWVKKDATVNNEIPFVLSNDNTSTSNRVFFQYQYSLNRFVVNFRTGTNNYSVQLPLHDASNAAITGTGTNSSTKWSNSNRGNVNSDGFCLITVTCDASQSNAANGIKIYWNTGLLGNSASTQSNRGSATNVNYLTIGNNAHNTTTTGGGFSGCFDEFKIYDKVLSAAEVSTIYNSGVPTDAASSVSSGLVTELKFENDVVDSAGIFPTTVINSATLTTIA